MVKKKNKHADKKWKYKSGSQTNPGPAGGKKVVIGAIERNGKVVLKYIPSAIREHMIPFVKENISKGTCIYTDEHQAYNELKQTYYHYSVQHKSRVYVRGNIHTNSIENFWSVMKRGINGTYHQISEKHIVRYLDEFACRFNTRNMDQSARLGFLLSQSNGRLKYKSLIS